jgi:hypothetical protein
MYIAVCTNSAVPMGTGATCSLKAPKWLSCKKTTSLSKVKGERPKALARMSVPVRRRVSRWCRRRKQTVFRLAKPSYGPLYPQRVRSAAPMTAASGIGSTFLVSRPCMRRRVLRRVTPAQLALAWLHREGS